MPYVAANLHLRAGAPGDLFYTYDAGADTLATVFGSGYFNNLTGNTNFVAEDLIWVQAADGNCFARVASVAANVVTLEFAGGNSPPGTLGTGTDDTLGSMVPRVGHFELASGAATATRYVLGTPYPGAEVLVRKVGSGTALFTFDAGGSGATSIVFDNDTTPNRRITLRYEGEHFHVVGASPTRWRILSTNFRSSGSEDLGGGGSVFFGAT